MSKGKSNNPKSFISCDYILCRNKGTESTEVNLSPSICPKCEKTNYCSMRCRMEDWYAGHHKACSVNPKSADQTVNKSEHKKSRGSGEEREKEGKYLHHQRELSVKSDTQGKTSALQKYTNPENNADTPFIKEGVMLGNYEAKKIEEQVKTKLSDFRVLDKKQIGKGSYGEVKLVKHKATSQIYAMKIIDKEALNNDPMNFMNLFKEIDIHKKLIHENIIRLYSHFEDTKNVYLVYYNIYIYI